MRTDWGFPGGSVVKNLPANAGDTGLIPDWGRSHLPQSNKAPEPQLRACALKPGSHNPRVHRPRAPALQ